MFYVYTFCFLFFLRRLCGGECLMFFRLFLCFCLCLCLCLYLYPCFCFCFCFCCCLCFSLSVSVSILVSVFYSYLPLLRVFVSYRKEVVRFPVDLSGRGTEQRFCVFLPVFSVIGPARRSVRPCCLPKARLFCAVGRSDAFS